jgi:hypothetical protein
MTMLVFSRGDGAYDAHRAEERPSDMPRLDDNLADVGAERVEVCTGETVRHYGM